jgi:hypothetical protein
MYMLELNHWEMNESLMRAYLEHITETRRVLEHQENRLYSLLVGSSGRSEDTTSSTGQASFLPVTQQVWRQSQATTPPESPPMPHPPDTSVDPVQIIMENLLRGIGIDISGGNTTPPSSWWDPIAVRPTDAEITRGVETLQYADIDDPTITLCPITQTDFHDTDEVMRIRACGHVFSSHALREWFTHSVRCPVCRHDVRAAVETDGVSGASTPPSLPMSASELLERTFESSFGTGSGTMDLSGAFISGYGGYMAEPSDVSFSVEITDGSGNVYHHRDFHRDFNIR